MGIKVDWKAYYEEFKLQHGEPIQYGRLLLFPDGWTYEMSYQGPEYAPPIDPSELHKLKQHYWTVRLERYVRVKRQLELQIDMIRDLQSTRSAPLQHRVLEFDDEAGKVVMRSRELTPDSLLGQLEDVEDQINRCRQQLKSFESVKVCTGLSRVEED